MNESVFEIPCTGRDTLKVNGNSVMQYDQPSFKATHTRGQPTWEDNGIGGVSAKWEYKPAEWYKRL
jgi:hypothetical protein